MTTLPVGAGSHVIAARLHLKHARAVYGCVLEGDAALELDAWLTRAEHATERAELILSTIRETEGPDDPRPEP